MAVGNLISAVVGGVVVGALFVVFAPVRPGPVPVSVLVATANREVAEKATQRRLDAIEDRVGAWEQQRSASVHRSAIASSPPAAPSQERRPHLGARLLALEKEVEDLRERLSLTTFEPQRSGDPDEARRILLGAVSDGTHTRHNNRNYFGEAMFRIPFRVRLLEGWPEHDGARSQLGSLVEDYTRTNQGHKAAAAVERFGPRIGVPSWQLDVLRLQAAHLDRDRIDIAQRVARNAVEPSNRAWGLMILAESLARTGRRDEALAAVDALVRQFARTEAGRGYVEAGQRLRASLVAGR